MRIIHIADLGLPGKRNGITEVVLNLSEAQRKLHHQVFVLNIRLKSCVEETDYINNVIDLKKFKKQIDSLAPDIVIFHSVYKWCFIPFSKYLRKLKIPYLVELHGGGSRVSQKKNALKKKIANFLLYNSFLKHSNGIIYLNNKEFDETIVFKNLSSAIIIPNGCHLPIINVNKSKDPNLLKFLFLARIDIYYKGLDIFVQAIDKIYKEIKGKVIFDFYGYTYDDTFQKMIEPYSDVLKYHSAVYGEEKDQVFRSADIFFLTSRSEGMPMSILEALSYGLPCLITPETNMVDIVRKDSGWIVNCNSDSIAAAIIKILNSSQEEIMLLGKHARKAVSDFSWDSIAKKSVIEYNNAINKVNSI